MLASISTVRPTFTPTPIAGGYIGSQVPEGTQAIIGPDLGSQVPQGAQAIIGPDLGSQVPEGAQALLPSHDVTDGVAQLGTDQHNCWDPRRWSTIQ